MISSTIGWAIILTYVSSRLMPTLYYRFKSRLKTQSLFFYFSTLTLPVILLLLLINPIKYAINQPRWILPSSYEYSFGYAELPIATQISSKFLELMHYSPDRNKLYFILDWEAAIDPNSGLFSPQEYKHLDAIRRNYPDKFNNHILSSNEFLEKHERFLIIDYESFTKKCPLNVRGLEKGRQWEDLHCPQWLEMRLLNNNNYKITYLGNVWGLAVLLAEKQSDL